MASLKEAFFWSGSTRPTSELSRDGARGTVEHSGTRWAALLAEPGDANCAPARVRGLFAAGPASEIVAEEDESVGRGHTSRGNRAAVGAGRLGAQTLSRARLVDGGVWGSMTTHDEASSETALGYEACVVGDRPSM